MRFSVPSDYRPPSQLPAGADAVRRALFGTKPDGVMVAYRTVQLLKTLRATDLWAYSDFLDPRISWDPSASHGWLVAPEAFGVHAPTLPENAMLVSGDPLDPDVQGDCCRWFSIRYASPGSLELRSGFPSPGLQVVSYDLEGDLTSAIPLPGTGWSVRLRNPDALGPFQLATIRRPRRTLGGLVNAVADLGESTLTTLFGLGSDEPYKSFRNLWRDHEEPAYRLGAVVTALVWRSEEARLG